jgi:perosamine synthetase
MMRSLLKRASINLEEHSWVKEILPAPEPKLKIGKNGRRIYVSSPHLAGNEQEYLRQCIDTNWISSKGNFIARFEKEFAAKIGASQAISCTSGTAALHLTLAALGLEPSSEIIIPSFTMIANPNTITHTGPRIQLVDSDIASWNMDIDQVEAQVNDRTRAIVTVHTYGVPAEMDRLSVIAEKHNLYLIEDAAEAHGAMYRNQKVGSIGDAGCFSFYANKIITTGEGGMVTTNNSELADIIRNLRDHAFSVERHFWHAYAGFNYRMTNMQAAIGCAQVEYFEELVQARIRHAGYYSEQLREIHGIQLAPQSKEGTSVPWMYCILVEPEFGKSRDELRYFLADRGVETRTFFIPIHIQPVYFYQFLGRRFPVAEELCRKGMYLPSSAALSQEDIDYICAAIREAAG